MWSKHNPYLQLFWDATSLRALQECPRKYQLSIIEGWREREESEHLTFGGLFQAAVERFQKARLRGLPLEEAGLEAFTFLVQASGEYVQTDDGACLVCDGPDFCAEMGRCTLDNPTYTFHPFAGHYATEWHCTGTEPFKNEKGNRAKCPSSHKGAWFLYDGSDPLTDKCQCGSPIEVADRWKPDHPTKNRETLLRTFIAFWDAQSESGGLQPFAFPDGTPAVELQVVVPMGRKAPGPQGWVPEVGGVYAHLAADGVVDDFVEPEDYLLVANIDEVNTWRGRTYPTDNKTTKNTLSEHFFQGFSPDVQFDLYDLISTLVPGLDPGGVAVRGIQVTASGNDVKTALITKTEGQREELWEDLGEWISLAERWAEAGRWPMNRSHCKLCPFRAICDMDPSMRGRHLAQNFHRRPWHPIHRSERMGNPPLEHNVPSPQVGGTE